MEKRDSVGEERRRGCDLLVRAVAWCEGNVKGRRGEEKREKRERGGFGEREKGRGRGAGEREKKEEKKKRKKEMGWAQFSFFGSCGRTDLLCGRTNFQFFDFFCDFSIFLVICIRAAAHIENAAAQTCVCLISNFKLADFIN